jgi:hypothetical protein
LRRIFITKRRATMTRFELESAIMSCWNTCEDIKLVSSKALEGNMTDDELANALIGIEQLHDMRCEKVFDIFEELISRGLLR